MVVAAESYDDSVLLFKHLLMEFSGKNEPVALALRSLPKGALNLHSLFPVLDLLPDFIGKGWRAGRCRLIFPSARGLKEIRTV